MNKHIKIKISEVLISLEKETSLENIEVSVPKEKKFGDFSTNILLKNRDIDQEAFRRILLEDSSIEKVENVNGFINIFLSKKIIDSEILTVKEKIKLNDAYLLSRMKNIQKRLEEENYISNSADIKNLDLVKIIKSYNNLCENLDSSNTLNYLEDLFNVFKKFDELVVYRKLDSSVLSNLNYLLDKIITLVERITYE